MGKRTILVRRDARGGLRGVDIYIGAGVSEIDTSSCDNSALFVERYDLDDPQSRERFAREAGYVPARSRALRRLRASAGPTPD